MTDQRACTFCKHCCKASLFMPALVVSAIEFPLCTHPSRRRDDVVHGSLLNYRPCGKAREDAADCGPSGHMFAPSLRHRLVTALFGRDAA